MPADKLRKEVLAQVAVAERAHTVIRSKLIRAPHSQSLPEDVAQFNATCLGIIDRVAGRRDAYYEQAFALIAQHEFTSAELAQALFGLVEALKADVTDGTLATFQERDHADQLGRLLDMAARLVAEGRLDPAAVLMSGVLEAHLTNLAMKHDVPLTAKYKDYPEETRSAELLNSDLAKIAYGPVERQAIAAWLAIRGTALYRAPGGQSRVRLVVWIDELRAFTANFPA